MNDNQCMGLRIKGENGELHYAITTHGSKLVGGGIKWENNKDHISQSRGSALDGEEHIGEWRIALGNHYAWLQTRWWRNQSGK